MLIGTGSIYYNSTFTITGFYSGRGDILSDNKANNLNKYSRFNNKNSIPSGYNPQYTWAPAIKNGGFAALNYANGNVYNSLLANAKNCAATLTGNGMVINADFALIVSMIATVVSEGFITQAQLAGVLEMIAAVIGHGEITEANLGAIIDLLASVNSNGSVNNASLLGKGYFSAHVYVNEGEQTKEQLAAAVWAASSTQNNEIGTMGQKLNSAATGGVDYESLAEAVWEYIDRTLTSGGGGTVIVDYDLIADTVWKAKSKSAKNVTL